MGDFNQTRGNVKVAVPNGIPPPSFPLPLPDGPDTITAILLLLGGQTPNPRLKFIYQNLIKHLHAFVKETNLTADEWKAATDFLTRAGQERKIGSLSGPLGVNALVDVLNNPVEGVETEQNILGPYYTDDSEDIELGGSIASEGKGEYMYVEGRVLTTEGEPIADAVINTWGSDQDGLYDVQYADGTRRDCRGRLRTGKDGNFGYRAVVPKPYAISCDGAIGELLISLGRHNMRPSHLHMMVDAPGYHKLVTQLYLEGCDYLTSDIVFAVKKSLVVKLEQIDDEAEARKRGFPKGGSFKLLKRDIVLLTEEQSRLIQQRAIGKQEESHLQDKDD